MVVLGGVVATLAPLDFRIDATFHNAPCFGSLVRESRNRHNCDGTPEKFFVDAGPLAPVGPPAFKSDGNLSLTTRGQPAIENHLRVRVVREPLRQMSVQRRVPQRYDEQVACHHVLYCAATCGRMWLVSQ